MKYRLMRIQIASSELLKPSVIALFAANLAPIYGVTFLGWEAFPLILLFWVENVIIGVYNVLKMLIATPGDSLKWLPKLFYIPFFCLHYGIFTFVHGVFVFGLLGGYFRKGAPSPDGMVVLQTILNYHLEWAILGLVVSHGISFVLNYIGRSEYRQSTIMHLMEQPYGRVIVMHLTILGGGFLMMVLHSPIVGLILLVLLKIALDVRAHVREHSSHPEKR
jgi:hypothetical protein